MNTEKLWFGLYIKNGAEKKVLQALHSRKVEHFYAKALMANTEHSFCKSMVKPLFPNYTFVRAERLRLEEFKKLNGVRSIIYRLVEPAVFPDTEMSMFRLFLDAHSESIISIAALKREDSKRVASPEEDLNQTYGAFHNQFLLPSIGYIIKATPLQTERRLLPEKKQVSWLMTKLAYGR